MALYNEIEPFACEWIDNLIKAGMIADGYVDRRSIRDLGASDTRNHTQAHFFAGIGVWSHALRQAGFSDDMPVWTGSCPCQPFSVAGQAKGFDDPRHLWPEWFRLIRECKPPIIFGEQVASEDGLRWLDTVSVDLEGAGYAVGAADLCAAGIGAPHIRQRLYFVAYASGERLERIHSLLLRWRQNKDLVETSRRSQTSDLGNTDGGGFRRQLASIFGSETTSGYQSDNHQSSDASGGMVYAHNTGSQGWGLQPDNKPNQWPVGSTGPVSGFWHDAEWIPCADGNFRPIEPGTFPLADRTPSHVGRLRAYGNAIVAPLATAFIESAMEAIDSAIRAR